jgi:hypothetical protein
MAERVGAQDLADLEAGTDPAVLLNLIERLPARVQALEEELARARDEINRLKGEQGRPGGLTKKRQRAEHSSDRERREAATTWHKGAKLPEVVIDREVACLLDPADLPEDARLKDHVEVTYWCLSGPDGGAGGGHPDLRRRAHLQGPDRGLGLVLGT